MIAFIVHTQDGGSLLPTTHNLKIPLLYTQNRVMTDSSTDKQWILARRTEGPSTAYALVRRGQDALQGSLRCSTKPFNRARNPETLGSVGEQQHQSAQTTGQAGFMALHNTLHCWGQDSRSGWAESSSHPFPPHRQQELQQRESGKARQYWVVTA
jgi:hypothetical protein